MGAVGTVAGATPGRGGGDCCCGSAPGGGRGGARDAFRVIRTTGDGPAITAVALPTLDEIFVT